MVTGITEAKFVAPNQIELRLIDGMTVKRMIDRGRMRESWEPRRDVLERKLCDLHELE